jgi:ribosomal protein L34E
MGGEAMATLHAPPVADRPRCGNCNKTLKPINQLKRLRTDGQGFVVNKRWTGQYRAYGHFCTLRCCNEFANWAYRQGYRR